ncbi:MAG: hypothetical protein ACI9S9_001897, partial [Planctomycetota bacterium]
MAFEREANHFTVLVADVSLACSSQPWLLAGVSSQSCTLDAIVEDVGQV